MEEPRPRIWKQALAATAIAGVVVLGPLTLSRLIGWAFPVELLTHFQVQYFLCAVACALVLASLRRWKWFMAAVVVGVIAASALQPYWSQDVSAKAYGGPRVLA